MKYIAIENHKTEFPNPITLKQGEKVSIGEETGETDIDGPNWVFCTKMDGSNKGWVPKQIIIFKDNNGEIIEDYSAKELDIDEGTIVEGIKEINSWLWSRNTITNEVGWVRLDKIKKLNNIV